ncbi:MFS transporter [Glaciimonas soli]|uniref:DHA2 family efflux MFS transporter permease subunit n=1 Tax=Glaciimonas soli TaxID=2590999 RepID=A0A843YRQ7_9BURK|nr:MFS transporter [Glaciimonas soli]MQR00203.1 DHA2 family efflux MFS transporter permease subunit [Glaciimonas soli]
MSLTFYSINAASNADLKKIKADNVEQDGLGLPRRYWAVLSILLGTFLGNLDAAIANIALPTIAHDLSGTPATTLWVANAYQLALAISVLPLAALGDMMGHKRIYLTGAIVFTLASIICAIAPSLHILIIARAVQGFGGACMSTVVPALLRSVFPQKIVGRGIALLALTVALSAALGPSAAALILSIANWHWLFAVNVPLGILVVTLATIILPRGRGVHRAFDSIGAILNALVFVFLIIGVAGLGNPAGDTSATIEIVVALVLAIILILQQRAHKTPLVPIDLLRIRQFTLAVLTSICSYMAQTIAYVSLPFLLEHQFGRNEVGTGLLMTPWPLVIVFVAPLAGRLSDRFEARNLTTIGLAVLALGLSLLAALPADASSGSIAWRIALCGIGFGFFQTPNNRVLLTSGPRERSGAAGGVMTMARMIGMTMGAALAGLMFKLNAGHVSQAALMLGAGFAVTGMAVSRIRG